MKAVLFLISFGFTLVSIGQKSFVEPYYRLKVSKEDSDLLFNTWKIFLDGIRKSDRQILSQASLSKVKCHAQGHLIAISAETKTLSIDYFIDSVITKIHNSELLGVMTDSTFKLSKTRYPDEKPSNFRLANGQNLILYDIYFTYAIPRGSAKYVSYIEFDFVKINARLAFFGLKIESPLP
jgi:hypothetical protein